MKSHGILSRYMRPGYARGNTVQELRGGEKLDKAFQKKKKDFFNLDIDGQDGNESGKDPVNNLYEWNDKDQEWYWTDPSKIDKEKLKNQDQWIFSRDEKGEFQAWPEETIMDDTSFLFYDNRMDYKTDRTKKKFTDAWDMAKGLGWLGKNYVKGKELKDDVSWGDTLKEYGKATGRTFLGGAKVLPEVGASIYRFMNPFEKLGGRGPIDTFTDDYETKEDYYIPYYSDFLGGKEKAGQGIFPDWLKSDTSLYQDDEFDEYIQSTLENEDPEDDMILRDKFSEQMGGIGLAEGVTLAGLGTGPVRNIAKILKQKKLADTINKSKNLKRLDNPLNQIVAATGLDALQNKIPPR
tara:strand:- start:556 stop:1608 length:1053 start_codon:yes stop_codon:yes gene_type:complete